MRKRRQLKKVLTAVTIILITASVIPSALNSVKADTVTDQLSVCVGYFGMDLSEYITVGDYHWSELEQNLPVQEEAYSYFKSGTFPTEYTAVVDAARGFLITEILDYSDIYYGDIVNILFYVVDAQGIWTAFDRDALFSPRYYFEDLAGHRRILYGTKEEDVLVGERKITEMREVLNPDTGEPVLGDDGKPVTEEVVVGTEPIYEKQTVTDYTNIQGYDFEGAWEACKGVQPMLAIEDNWASFNEEFEHIGPDFSYMNTANRFRLLFGQSFPTESMTQQSAKYVSRIYVTLEGAPSIGEMPEIKEGSNGSHEVRVQITGVYNKDLRDELSKYIKIESTNGDILRIDDIEVTPSEAYTDVATVRIRYSIIGDGNASISASIGSVSLTDNNGKTLNDFTDVTQEKPTEEKPSGEEPTEEKSAKVQPDEKLQEKPREKESGIQSEKKQQENHQNESEKVAELAKGDSGQEDAAQSTENVSEIMKNQVVAYQLTGNVLDQLNKLQNNTERVAEADRNITEVKVQEEDEDKFRAEQLLMVSTALGICLSGSLSEAVAFGYKKNRKIKKA